MEVLERYAKAFRVDFMWLLKGDQLAGGDFDADLLTVPFAADVRAAAGSGDIVFEEAADMKVEVPRAVLPRWVDRRGLICIRAAGDSMEPTLSNGHLILLDRSQIEPVDEKVFVIHTEDGLVVKRVRKTDEGWQMTSDNRAYKSRPLGEWDRNVGRVAWSGPVPGIEAGG